MDLDDLPTGEIWSCSDGQGAEWTCEATSAAWPARYGHSLLLLESAGHETLLLLGGADAWETGGGAFLVVQIKNEMDEI